MYRIKLLPTFSYISIVVSACIGRVSQNGSHMLLYSCQPSRVSPELSRNLTICPGIRSICPGILIFCLAIIVYIMFAIFQFFV